MFIHAVLMAFTPETGDDFHRQVEVYAETIRREGRGEGLVSYLYAVNEAGRSDGLTHAVVASFDDEAAHERYQASAVHQEMKAFMAPNTERLVVFDSGHWR
ncbi:MAG: Dabb family protein [Comamonadaceae bacterium]|nr:MAG: Dabb family protein [Comamonadaceae bacterium]